ncbi:MAG: N-6 DNA methylase [Methanomassiliicoccales archaeon]|nr:N-6 DNA methylase [Methanomassiliicoccales archaeon]
MPDDPIQSFIDSLPSYIDEVKAANSEASKSSAFIYLIRKTFSTINIDHPKRLIPELEKYVSIKSGSVLIRGRIDALLGNVIIEFKETLNATKTIEAEDQLKQYLAGLWLIDGSRTNYVLMATDGLIFKVYRPVVTSEGPVNPLDISIEEVNRLNIESSNSELAFRWLDRYVLYRDRIPPKSKEIVNDFGEDSPIFNSAMADMKIAWEVAKPLSSAIFEEWSRYLSAVYGERIDSEDLFLRHTYIATFAKFMVYSYYSGGAIPSAEEIADVLSGTAFKELGIKNFLEEDFFSWLSRNELERKGELISWKIIEGFERYDLTLLNEDVLKAMYQELVDPESRHDLGEYYTPDWLAEYVVEEMNVGVDSRSLDPSCGSGTFLAFLIRKKIELSTLSPAETLNRILDTVIGFDIHPLAVLVAKANYLMALGKLLESRVTDIKIPIFLANSIVFPEATMDIEKRIVVYRYPASDGISLAVPESIIVSGLVEDVIDALNDYAKSVIAGKTTTDKEWFSSYLFTINPKISSLGQETVDILWETCNNLIKLINLNKDTIYGYIIKNVYKPATSGKFDIIVGNPPWLTYSDIKDTGYQLKIKRLIIDVHKLLINTDTKLMTHMELATLFYVRCSYVFLKPSGKIGFVMPGSIFNADQHKIFRSASFVPKIRFEQVIDLTGVTPLFKVPSSVIIGRRGDS